MGPTIRAKGLRRPRNPLPNGFGTRTHWGAGRCRCRDGLGRPLDTPIVLGSGLLSVRTVTTVPYGYEQVTGGVLEPPRRPGLEEHHSTGRRLRAQRHPPVDSAAFEWKQLLRTGRELLRLGWTPNRAADVPHKKCEELLDV